MKKLLFLLIALLAGVSGAWAETSTWESKEGWTQASGGMGSYTWFGVHTPGDASTKYSLTAIQLMQQTGSGNNDNYLAIARVSATSTLDANHVVAISDNHLAASQSTGSLETYNFSAGVELLGGTTYYLVFLSSNTPTDGAYPVRAGRLSLNHTDYGTYTYGNSYSMTSTHWLYYKATVESSSATDYCTGDHLGGTSPSGNWIASWTSGTTPSFTITSSANNINNSASKPAGGLDIRSGSAESATYTITAPTGYVITGYKLFGYALTAANTQTVTPAEGGSAVGFTGVGNSLCVSGLHKASTSFVLTGANTGLFLQALQVSLTPYTSITSLPTANNKAYVIANARATFNFADAATGMSVVTPVNTNYDNTQQRIALIYKNENYYLFSVNAGKYLTANNTLTSMPTDNEQVSITATGNATYPWFFSFKNIADKNINVTGYPALTIDGWSTIDGGNSNAIIEAADFDATLALEMFDVRNVTYNLSFEGGSTLDTESDVTVTIGGDPADFVPSRFTNPFVTLSYSPATIAAETTEVTVTATWNGPFQISDNYASAIWQVVQMHTYPGYPAEKWSWSYRSDDSDKVKPEQVLEYDAVTTNRLFCFVGNPYEGFKIYNASAGSGYTLTRSGESDEISMASGDHIFTLHASAVNPDATTYFCLKPSGATNYVNYDYNNTRITGWSDADNGSTCWVVAPGQYYLDFIDGLYLDAPVGAVGTRTYFQDVANAETAKTNIRGYRTTVANNMYSNELGSLNTYLNPVKATDVITLADGYYRFVNAYPSWTTNAPTIYYNSTSNRIEWSKASNASDNVNSIFYIDAATPSIYSLNAQKYMSVISSEVSGSLADESGTTVFTSLGSAQYNVIVGGGTMHTAGHSSGAGNSGNLTSWGGGVNEASAWYIVQVEDLDIALHSDGAGTPTYYATLCLPFDATISDADAYTLEESGSWLVPTAVTDNEVPAGTPVLLKGTSGSTAIATINTGAAFNSGSPLACALTGVYKATTIDGATDYVLGIYDGVVGFYHWNQSSLAANRAYIDTPAAVKGFVINWNDADGITSVQGSESKVKGTEIYNLAGQRMNRVQKGVNIVNGKKVLVK